VRCEGGGEAGGGPLVEPGSDWVASIGAEKVRPSATGGARCGRPASSSIASSAPLRFADAHAAAAAGSRKPIDECDRESGAGGGGASCCCCSASYWCMAAADAGRGTSAAGGAEKLSSTGGSSCIVGANMGDAETGVTERIDAVDGHGE